MDFNQQIFIFLLLLLLILLIYNMKSPNKSENNDIKKIQNFVDTNNKSINNKKERSKKRKDNGKFELWEKQWLSRNTQVKQCYNNCQGLRKNDYSICIDNCIKNNDNFYKNMVKREHGTIKNYDPNYLKI